jgi:ammonium transporter, Amt family
MKYLFRKHTLYVMLSFLILVCIPANIFAVESVAGYVTVQSALIIGLIATPICYIAIHFIKACFKYDDKLDAFGVHGIGGIWGAIATGLFATKSVNPAGNNGLFYGNQEQLLHQSVGVITTIVLANVGTFIILKIVSLFTSLRVSKEDELMGLDLSFHDEPAYNTDVDDQTIMNHPFTKTITS